MCDRKMLLALVASGIFVTLPGGRSFAAAPDVHLASMSAPASDDDEKPNPKHTEKDDDHDDKDEHEDRHGGDEKKAKTEIEQAVPMNMVPPAVIEAVMKECPGGKITEAELVAKKGKIVYSFDVKTADTAYEVKIGVDGKFVSKKVDDDGDDEKDEKKPAMPDKK